MIEDFLNQLRKKKPKRKNVSWIPCKVVFLGAEKYELCTVEALATVRIVPGGFQTVFKAPVAVKSEALMGKSVAFGVIADIELRMPDFTMSLATMYPGDFPKIVQKGEEVGVSRG